MTTAWAKAAELLEQEPPDDDLDRQIRPAARRLDWRDCGARLVSCLRELRPYPSEEEAARIASAGLPGLRPQGWPGAPRGEALVEAVLGAYRASPWQEPPSRPSRISSTGRASPPPAAGPDGGHPPSGRCSSPQAEPTS